MKIRLVKLEKLSKDETYFIVGGQIDPEKKKKRQEQRAKSKKNRDDRKARRKCNSDITDTLKNDTFKI